MTDDAPAPPLGPFRRRLLINTASVGIANGWTMVVTLVSLPLLLHGLGTTAFGTWALLLTFSAVSGWGSLLDLGLGVATTREVASRHAVDDDPGLGAAVGTSLVAHLGLGLGAGLLFAAIGPWTLPTLFNTPDHLIRPLRIAIVVFGVQLAADLLVGGCQAVLDGFQRVDRSRAVEIVRRTLFGGATAGAAVVTERLDAVAIASAVAAVISATIGVVVARRTTRGVRPAVRRQTLVDLLRYGREVLLLRPLGVLHRTIDRLVVGVVLGPAAVSLVEVVNQLDLGVQSVVSAASYAVVPGAARLDARGDAHRLRELAETGTRYLLLVCWPLAGTAAVLAGPALDLWVGPSYADAAGLVVLAMLSTLLVAPAQVGSNLLLGTGGVREILRVALIGIAVNLVGSIVLVHVVGIAGAFQATIASSAISLPLLLAATVHHVGGSVREFLRSTARPVLPALVAATLSALAVVSLPLASAPTLLLGGSVATLAAARAVWVWGLTPHERSTVNSRLRRRG